MYQILKAFDYANSLGIMHRDIKPMNIMIDPNQRLLRVIDWGLSEFYFPNSHMSTGMGTRHFKAPELFLNITDYDYGIDMWALGEMFG
jgi:casein kinase II subunit alpha